VGGGHKERALTHGYSMFTPFGFPAATGKHAHRTLRETAFEDALPSSHRSAEIDFHISTATGGESATTPTVLHPKLTSASTFRHYVNVSIWVCKLLKLLARIIASMKTNSKTIRLFIATPSLLATRLFVALWLVSSSLLQFPAQNVELTGAIGGRVTGQSGALVPGA
jgi:hypothetical protein